MGAFLKRFSRQLLACCCLLASAAPALAASEILSAAEDLKPGEDGLPPPLEKPLHVTVCFFDFQGKNGDFYSQAKDLALIAQRWNVYADLKVFTDERVTAENFKVGQCDAAGISTLRARQFNPFVGSLDAIGAILSYQQLTEAINFLAKPEMGAYMVNQDVEIVGIVPLGAAYVMVNDRRINTLAKAAGRKVAVLDFDKSQATMVQKIGAQPVSVDLTSIGGKFNNGQVDILALPALAFEPLELYRGMTDDKGNARGAIFKFPLLQVTGVMMMHRGKFPDGIGQLVREFTAMQLAPAYQFILETESAIPVKYWMDIPESDKPGYVNMLRNARLAVTKDGFYDPRMMQLLKKIRCKLEPGNYECSLNDE